MIERWVSRHTETTISDCTEVLSSQNLTWEPDIEYSVIIYNSIDSSYTDPIATGSFSANVIKCIAVTPLFEGSGLAQRIVFLLIEELHARSVDNIFLFTKPRNVPTFGELGFHPLVSDNHLVTLMEQNPEGVQNFCRSLSAVKMETGTHDPTIGSLVVNCNPFTNGHRWIIEQASSACDLLYLFVVSENRSEFSTTERLALVKKGISDLQNVIVTEGGDYIISRGTFPTYFMKETRQVNQAYARIDAAVFAGFIAPALGITLRFVGEEPFCPVTRDYNEQLAEILPKAGITLTVIPRKEYNGKAISASRVRELFAAGLIDEIAPLVPETTLNFLTSAASAAVRDRIFKKQSVNGSKESHQ